MPVAAFKLPAEFPLTEAALLEPAGVAMHAVQRYGKLPARAPRSHHGRRPGRSLHCRTGQNRRRSESRCRRAQSVSPRVRRQPGGAAGANRPARWWRCAATWVLTAAVSMSASRRRAIDHPSPRSWTRCGSTEPTYRWDSPGPPAKSTPPNTSTARAITLVGSFGRRLWDTWDIIVALVSSGELDLGKFITHRLGLDEFELAIELLAQDSCKVVFLPGDRAVTRDRSPRHRQRPLPERRCRGSEH